MFWYRYSILFNLSATTKGKSLCVKVEKNTVEVAFNESPGTFKSDSLHPEFVISVAPVITIFFPAASL